VKYLLDTNALLWWLSNDISLSHEAQTKIGSPDNLIFVSVVSAWEISIKKAIGKLDAPDDLEAAIIDSRFEPLSISIGDGIAAGKLPHYHNDPFDRMLIAQAISYDLIIITSDHKFEQYDVKLLNT
jgi:PIN domain nuclease of toxin-antitoxin system